MSMRERTTRKWVTRFVAAISAMVALFVLIFSVISPNEANHVYGLTTEVTTQAELLSALASSEYDEIILKNVITLTDGTVLDGDLDDDGTRKTIRASVTGTTDQGVINSNASNYSLFYVAANATVHINNCIIKGGGQSAIVNGASSGATNNNSTLYIDKCQISNSGSEGIHGGGIRNTVGSKIVLTNSSLTRNVAQYGAGFQNQQGTFIIDNCSISENRSLAFGGGGGENTGNEGRNEANAYMYIYNSTIANNTSKEIGGGINNCKKANLYIINSTIAGNATTNGSESGAGVGNNNNATLTCVNSILLDNVYLSDNSEVEQDAYSYGTGSVTLDGCVYGAVTGKTQALANAIDVEDTCYQVNDSDSVFAATKVGSLINEDGSQGNITYNQVALVEDENGVTYAPLASDSMALAGNSSITPVKVEFDYSDLSNITYHTGNECSISTEAPTTIGGGSAVSANEKVVTVTVFVNEDFIIDGGTVYGDSYIINSNESSNITLSATSATGDESVSVAWALVDQENETLEIVSGNNPYTIDTSLNSVVMQHSWDSSKNSYDIVLQPITLSLAATAGDSQVTLNWSLNWQNTFCSNYEISNSASAFDIYYSLVNDFNSPATTKFGSVEGTKTTATVTGLENETTYYFFVLPQGGEETVDDEIVGYVAATPKGNTKTYGLATSIEANGTYLIVSAGSVGSAKALTSLTSGNYGTGSLTTLTISESSNGIPYIKTSAQDTMIWTATKYNNNWRLKSGSYYIYMYSDTRILYNRTANMTVTFNDDGSATIYGNNRYLSLSESTPTRSQTATKVYFFKEKTTKDAPTGITSSMQSIIGENSGTISNVSTLMEYSTNGVDWTTCPGATMTNVPVGKYFFRYKETSLTFASKAVTVEVLPKKITNFNIKTSPELNYTAGDALDLSSLVVTIIYNDNTTTDVPFASFASLDSSVYQRENGIITVSMNNGSILGCSNNGNKITVSLDTFTTTTLALNIAHKYVNVAAKAATCEESGNLEYYYCDSCGKIFDSLKNETTLLAVTINPLGHSYGTPTYTWSSDNSTCTARVVCSHDSTHVITETVNTTNEITTNPTCTATGIRTYTAAFTNTTYFNTQTRTEAVEALGHEYDYSNGEWTWHNNYYVTVVFRCTHDQTHTVSYTATMSNSITKEATCEEAGIHTYFATVTIDGVDYVDTKEEEIAPKGHNYSYPTYTWSSDYSSCTATRVCQNDSTHIISETVASTSEITTNPTCTTTGVRTYTAVFTNTDDFTTQTTTSIVPALGHDYDYDNGVWNWNSVYYVTITFTCKNDSSHTITEQATVTNEVTKEATCEEAGIRLYTASVTVNGVTYTDTYEDTIAPIGHTYGTPTYTWSSDNKTCTATVVCTHDSTHIITETVNSISDVDKEPTCDEEGRGLFTATFTNTAYFYTQVVYSVIPALGHDYEISYEWNGVNSVTATAICKHDNTHVVTETKNATSVTVNPTCTLDGSITYTVVFEDDLFESQELIVTLTKLGHSPEAPVEENRIEATCTTDGSYDTVTYCSVCGEELSREHHEILAFGHDYGEVTYTWNSDNTKVTASRVCDICYHVDTEEVSTTSLTVNPTCTLKGKTTYTAVFTNSAFDTQTKKVEIPALGHTAGNPVEENRIEATCTTDGSYDTVVYCTVCGEELDRVHHEIEAFGHTYGDITYIWSSDNLTVTATRSCDTCGYDDEEIVVTTSVTVNPTCTATGKITYTAVFTNPDFETQTKEVEIPSLGHAEGEAVEENRIDATCTTAGSYDTVVYCTVCGEETSREHHTIPALGHAYGEVTYTWNSDNSKVTATRVCSVCGDIDTETVDTTSVTVNPTCTLNGKTTYTAVFTNAAFETQTEEVEIPSFGHTNGEAVIENEVAATCTTAGSYDTVVYCTVCGEELSRITTTIPAFGHEYGNVTYIWSSDNSKVTATRICNHDHNHIETETVATTSVTVNPTCTVAGKVTYTVTFTNSDFEDQTKVVDIPALGHIEALAVEENRIDATCTTAGSYDLVIYCTVCGEELSRDHQEIEALGHTHAAAVTENEVAATCTEAGSYDTVVYCTVCGEELDRVHHTIDALGHTPLDAVEENRIDATCETAGSYDTVVYCSVCDGEISREHHTIPALGHAYGEVTYIWNSDNSEVTATRVCEHDNNHVETETVTTSYKITTNPTCTETGIRTYTAVFTNPAFATQTKNETVAALGHKGGNSVFENEVDATCTTDGSYDVVVYCSVCGEELSRDTITVDALGHTFGEVTYTWSSDNSSVTATRVCSVCGDIETETVATTSITVNPTCLLAGKTTYTATFTNPVFIAQTKEIEIPVLGHEYGSVTYTWSSDNSEVTATRVCAHDATHIETETVSTTSVTVNPTCTFAGKITYTATFTNPAFEVQTKEEEIAALGHSYGEVTYTWSDDYSSVTATRVCSICADEDTETVATTSVTVNATCTTAGIITYTAEFTNPVFDAQTTQVTIPALGHEYGVASYTWSSDNTTVTARVVCSHDSTHVITESVKTTSQVLTEATCETSGVKKYTAVFTSTYFEAQTKEVEIPALGHNFTHYELVPASCTLSGMEEYYYCENCNKYFDKNYNETTLDALVIEALGHSYDYANGTWTWSNDYKNATYKVTCLNNSAHTLSFNATITDEITLDTTCTATGIRTYTAIVTVEGNTYTSTREVSIPALGHEFDYSVGEWTWSIDYTSATISFACTNDNSHKDTYNATISSSITVNPTCTAKGVKTYTAKVTLNGVVYIDTKTKELDTVPHTYSHVDSIDATCEDSGIHEHYLCTACGEYFDSEYNLVSYDSLIIPALGHNYDYANGTWIWAVDYSSATYYVSCTNDNAHTLSYTATITSKTIALATHTETGKLELTATVEVNGVTYTNIAYEDTPRLHHIVSTKVLAKEPTCEANGNILYYYCEDCNTYYIDPAMENEISYSDTIIPALGHAYVHYDKVDATCTTPGMNEYYTCENCDKVFDSNKNETTLTDLVINALGHTDGTPVEENRINPTCETVGSYDLVIYCTVCGEELSREPQVIPALGHAYVHHDKVDATCTTSGMDEYYTCENCDKVFDSNKNETILTDLVINALGHTHATPVEENVVNPTCTATGSYDSVIYCTVCGEKLSREHHTIDALGHTEGSPVEENRVNPTCEATGSYDLVIYCTVCGEELSREPQVIPALGHTYIHHDKVDATCTTAGMNEYYTCENCDKVFDSNKNETTLADLVINALGHTHATPVEENRIDATCEVAGSYDLVTYCTVCGEELSREPHTIPALGHTYGLATYSWNLDHTACTAERTCLVCGSIDSEVATITTIVINATCISNGSIKYTATFTNPEFATQTYTEVINALGHDYQITYTWSNDNKTLTATAVCTHDSNHRITETVATTSITVAATCEANGSITYTALFTDDTFATQTKVLELQALGHTLGTPVEENRINPTCTETGSYDLVTYCIVCGEELHRETIEVKAQGHIDGTPVEENRIEATCEMSGSYDLVIYCTICGEELSRKTKTIDALGHTYIHHDANAATCTHSGNYEYYTCEDCDKVFDSDKNVTTLADLVIAALGHREGSPVEENRIEATCEDAGSYDLVIYCTVCHEELSRESKTIEALGHTYGDITYTWSIDNLSVTATRICTICGHEEEETVATTSITASSTCEASGSILYTAEFENNAFETQTKEVIIPALGHSYKSTVVSPTCEDKGYTIHICERCNDTYIDNYRDALGHDYNSYSWTWDDDYLAATITFTCSYDNNHKEVISVNSTSVTVNPTCEATGSITYTVTIEFEGNTYKDTKVVSLDALGHRDGTPVEENRIDATCEAAGSYDLVIYCSECGEELDREHHEIPALGHDYDYQNGVWDWASDYLTCCYIVTCKHDNNHIYTYTVTSTGEVLLEPTHEANGTIEYHVSVTILDNTYETSIEVVLPKLHHETSITVAEKEATCDEDGNIRYYHCVECGKNFKDSHMTIEIELEDTIIPALGHDYIHHAKVDATCVNDGLDEHYTCSRCGKVFDSNKVETNLEDLVISALGHNYIAVVTNPTCEADGYTTYTCSICGDSYVSDLVDALGHDYEISYIWNSDNSKVFAYALCNTCGDSIYEEAIVVSTIKNPTCKQEGLVTYKAEFTNSIFNTQIKEEVLDKLSHTEGDAVIENLVSSTCSEEGSYDSVIYCTVCHEELHRHNVTVDKVDHSYTSVVTNPTCDSQGFTTYTCERCGDSYVSDFVDALGHSYTSVVTDPTCDSQGYTTYTCERCGHSYVADLVDALGHNYEITYTWNGNSKVTATAVCKHNNLHIITETVTTSSKTIDATCEEAGKITYLATFSNPLFESQSKEVVINALGHNLVFHDEVTPTCEETGLLAYYTCSRCGKVFDLNMDEVNLSDLVIPALGHNTISFITEPTCEEAGYTTYICDRCGETYVSDYTDALGHSYTAVVTNPTCENQGYTTYTCERCGHSYVSDYTDALGHTYQISYEWSSDNSKVIAKALCFVCGDEITEEASTSYTLILDPTCTNEGLGKYIVNFTNSLFSSLEKEIILDSLGHDLVFHDELLPTCKNPGHNAYHTCSRCDYSTFEHINALGHNASSAVEENRIEATCDTAGSYDLVVYCIVCGEELSRTKMTILATGHSYTSIVTLPTCEAEGYTTHTCSICNHTYIDNHISALGHSYGEVVYEWSDDYLTITATKTCLRCGKVVKEVSDTLVTIVKDATCTDTGIQCYTSNFKLFDNISKNIVIPKINHTYGDLVEENRIEATCEVDGSYDSVIYCTVCGEELSREPLTIPALGHDFDYANGVWSWNNYDSAKYIIYCKHNYSEKEIYTAEIESTLTKAPTDLETGLRVYTAKVTILGITYTDSLTEVIPTTDHTITIVYGVLPTCENSGNITYYYCESCDKYYSDAELKNEITYEETILAPLGHDYISHKAKAATCTEAGYDAYQTCSRCDYSTYHEIPALGHNFITQVIAPTCTESGYTLHTCSNCNESFIDTYESALGHDYQITYTWASDYSSITAKAICHHDDSHIIIEVVNTKSSTITLATCDSDGSIKYSAVFENALFEAQAKIIKVAKLGHKEGEAAIENVVAATCTTDGSHDLVYYCTVCSEELNRISVLDPALGHSLVHHDGVDATCKESGYYDYDICSVCGYSTYKEIPALGHSDLEVVKVVIEEATCLGTGAHYDVTYCTVCHEELNRVIVIDEKLGHNYIDETIMATCTTPGYTAHTCSRCGKYYEDNNILPLGHDYSNIEYEWNSDNTYCVAYAYCSHDHNHVIKEETYSSYVIMSNPTCEEDGLKIYTANFTNIRFENQNKNVVIPALGHSYLEAEYTWNEYNSIVTASRLCEVCNHIDTLVSHTTSQTIAETCEEDGLIIYTAVFNDPAYEAQTKEVVIPHHGHLYGDVVYEWNNDYSKCHAIRVCQYDDNHIDEEISTSTNIKVLPTCLNDGLITYNAKFESREFETQVQKVVIPALGHDYCYHDIVLATCEVDGIDSYYTCNRCGEIFDKNKNTATMDDFILEAFGHLYGDVTYTWSSDYLSCKAVRVCSHDQNHIEEEVSYSSYVTVDPTCTNTGLVTYTVVFENKAFDTIIKKVVIPALGHSNSDIVIENHMDATCEDDGSYDSVIYCSVCGEELSRIHSIIYAFGHSYGDVSYTWSNDYKSVVAIRVCSHDESHIEEEVSYTTSKVKVAPTCEATGVMTYTAKFTNPAFATQVFNVSMNALGHDYDSWYLVDLPTKSETGLICRVCKNDSNHKEYYEVPKLNDIDYAYSILTEATGATDGKAEYLEVFNGVEIRVTEVIPAYGFYYSYYKNNIAIATYHGFDGDSLEVPSDLDSYVVNGYVYYFNGWDKEIPSELHEDMKFYAKFIIAAVIYNDAVIEIPENLTIDTSYRILVEKETNENTINSRIERLTNIDDYSDFDLQSAFRIVFEKDGKTVSLADDVSITIKIKADRIDNLDSSTKLFYFNEDGKVQELNYRIENGYVIFEMGTVGAIGFANDGFNWLWAVFVIQSMSIVMLVVVIVYRKKVKA